MSKKKKLTISSQVEGGGSLVPEEDEAFESAAAQQYRDLIADEENYLQQQKKNEKQAQRNYEQKLRDEKIAMMRAKQGIDEQEPSEQSAEQEKEEQEQPVKKSFKKKLENFWYHYKFATIVAVIAISFGAVMIYQLVTKVNPDMTIIVTVDNGLAYRADMVELFFENYCEDLNGDGKAVVEVMFTPMNKNSGSDQLSQSYETKLYANLSNSECVLFLTDTESAFALENVTFDDLSDKLSSQYVDGDKISLDCKLVRDGFTWAQMPDDMVLMIRTPVKTLYSSVEKMQEAYDDSFAFLERLLDAMDNYKG